MVSYNCTLGSVYRVVVLSSKIFDSEDFFETLSSEEVQFISENKKFSETDSMLEVVESDFEEGLEQAQKDMQRAMATISDIIFFMVSSNFMQNFYITKLSYFYRNVKQ